MNNAWGKIFPVQSIRAFSAGCPHLSKNDKSLVIQREFNVELLQSHIKSESNDALKGLYICSGLEEYWRHPRLCNLHKFFIKVYTVFYLFPTTFIYGYCNVLDRWTITFEPQPCCTFCLYLSSLALDIKHHIQYMKVYYLSSGGFRSIKHEDKKAYIQCIVIWDVQSLLEPSSSVHFYF